MAYNFRCPKIRYLQVGTSRTTRSIGCSALISTTSRRPVTDTFFGEARAIPEARAFRTGPFCARYFFVCAGQRAISRREECFWGTRVLAQVEVRRLAERVLRLGDRLAAPLLVALDGTQIGNLYDDALKRALVAWRVRVRRTSHPEAPPTRIPGTYTCRSTKGKLVHCSRMARGGFPTCWIAAAIVICKGRSARSLLHVVALGSDFEDRTTARRGGEKEGRNEDENRFHDGWRSCLYTTAHILGSPIFFLAKNHEIVFCIA